MIPRYHSDWLRHSLTQLSRRRGYRAPLRRGVELDRQLGLNEAVLRTKVLRMEQH